MNPIKTNSLIALCILFVTSASSQSKKSKADEEHENFFRFGAKAGVNINKISGQSYTSGFNYNFQGGGFLQFNFGRLGIQPEVNFVQTQAEFTNDTNTIYDDLFNGGAQHKAKLNYLEVPVLLNINLGESKRVKLQLGPSYGAVLKQTVDSLKNNGDIFRNGEWSVMGGLWFQLPVVNLSVRYKAGLTDINDIDNRQTWRNQAIQVGVGITF